MAEGLATGRIVWAEIIDANGIGKLRPGVIVTPTERLRPGCSLDLVAITSRLARPLPRDHVRLPWHHQGYLRTGLNRPCAAVCSWVVQIGETDIKALAGMVPTPLMAKILTKLASALPPPGGESAS